MSEDIERDLQHVIIETDLLTLKLLKAAVGAAIGSLPSDKLPGVLGVYQDIYEELSTIIQRQTGEHSSSTTTKYLN